MRTWATTSCEATDGGTVASDDELAPVPPEGDGWRLVSVALIPGSRGWWLQYFWEREGAEVGR
jgi:hypothetical protein